MVSGVKVSVGPTESLQVAETLITKIQTMAESENIKEIVNQAAVVTVVLKVLRHTGMIPANYCSES